MFVWGHLVCGGSAGLDLWMDKEGKFASHRLTSELKSSIMLSKTQIYFLLIHTSSLVVDNQWLFGGHLVHGVCVMLNFPQVTVQKPAFCIRSCQCIPLGHTKSCIKRMQINFGSLLFGSKCKCFCFLLLVM